MFEILDNSTVEEPVNIRELRAACRIDDDYLVFDSDLMDYAFQARKFMESQLDVGLVKREIKVQWDGSPLRLPLYPTGTIIKVEGENGELAADKYTVTKYAGATLWINSVYNTRADYFYTVTGQVHVNRIRPESTGEMFTVTYECGYESLQLDFKAAIKKHVKHLFQLDGAPDDNPLGSGAIALVISHSRNLPLG